MNRCWCFPDPSSQKAASRLARQLDLVPAFGSILARMGLAEETAAQQFLFPRLRNLHDPFEIGGVRSAVDLILTAIDYRQRIVLYGDYDVDGVTSVALLYRVLKAFGADVHTFLPHRLEEGYGLSEEAVQRCLTTFSPRLLVALDCGTAAAERILGIESCGVDVLVVDHHKANGRLPSCRALVKAWLGTEYHYLCAAGLVFKLRHALTQRRQLPRVDL